MQWEFIVALVLGIPIILLPVALVWYLNIGGIYEAIQKAWKEKAVREETTRSVVEENREKKKPVSARH